MRKFKLLMLIVLISLVLSGCQLSLGKKRTPPPEMILAQACGQDKLKCCSDEPKCSFGQKCCPDPSGEPRNYCSDECSYGGLDEFCNPDSPKCKDGLACVGGFCLKCGLAGGPCCETGEACPGADGGEKNFVECRAGRCVACGVDGQAACAGIKPCAKSHLLNNGICYRCGGVNQACCRDEQGTQNCDKEKGLVCELGFCQETINNISIPPIPGS